MAISGRSIEKEFDVEEVSRLLLEYGGNVSTVAKFMGCGRNTVYDYIDIYPELQEVRAKALYRMGDTELDGAYTVIEKLMERVEEDPSNAFKSANLILNKGKKSRYYEDKAAAEAQVDARTDKLLGDMENFIDGVKGVNETTSE